MLNNKGQLARSHQKIVLSKKKMGQATKPVKCMMKYPARLLVRKHTNTNDPS